MRCRTPQAFRPGFTGSLEALEARQLLASLEISATPSVTVAEGKTATVTYTITNTGTTTETGVQFYTETGDDYVNNANAGQPLQPSIGLTYLDLFAIESSRTVALGSLAAGASTTVQVVITANSAGQEGLFGLVGSIQEPYAPYDPTSGTQTSTTHVVITGSPDLGVVALPPVGQAAVGVPITFSFVVTNHDTAGSIEAGYLVSSALVVQSVTGTVTTAHSVPEPLHGYYGVLVTLQAGATDTLAVTVIPTQPGPVVVEFATSSASINAAPEANAVNNFAFAGAPAVPTPVVTTSFLSPATGNIQDVTLDFASPLVASTADHLSNYKLTTVIAGKTTAIPLKFVTYDAKTDRVVLGLKKPQPRAGQPLTVTLSGLLAVGGGGLAPGGNVVTLTR
jgi:hypothetical protein